MVKSFGKNPLTRLDYPDPDVIRVGDTYYMCSTTMYFMPGCVILRSYDLINWEFCCHVYDKLEDTDRENLENGGAYGAGMWAPTLRYNDGVFHIVFIANDTGKTYHFTSHDIMGPWKKSYIKGFYHDSSILFDDDGRVYIMYGNRDIRVTELESDLSGPKAGGVDKVVISDPPGNGLGLEGCHLYKINGRYYAFFIHSLPKRWVRVEAAFMSDRIDEGWHGGDVIVDEFDNTSGVAQGGIVETPSGNYYGVIFADRGAAGRIPNLVPMHFDETGFPVFDKPSFDIECENNKPGYQYKKLIHSDDFAQGFGCAWEFNHNPILERIHFDSGLIIEPLSAPSLEYAKNTATQRALYPRCAAEVTVDGSGLEVGGYAGICALQYRYGALGIERCEDGFYAVLRLRDNGEEYVAEKYKCDNKLKLRVQFEFGPGADFAEFFVLTDKKWLQLGGKHHMTFDLRHFTGCRIGLFCYTYGKPVGSAKFTNFVYDDYE